MKCLKVNLKVGHSIVLTKLKVTSELVSLRMKLIYGHCPLISEYAWERVTDPMDKVGDEMQGVDSGRQG